MAVEQQASARRRQMLGLIIGLIVAGGSGLGLFYLVSKSGGTSGGPAAGPTTQVVVASQPIPKGTKLDATNIELATVPQANVPQPAQGQPQLAFNGTDVLTTSDHYAAIDIGQGEILTTSNTATTAAGSTTSFAPLQVRDNDVAMAVPVTDLKGIGGWISPGDHIDVIADVTGGGSIQYVMQDIPVLRIGSTSQQTAGAQVTLIVVEVNRLQAEELAFLINDKGLPNVALVSYVLRPKDQWGVFPKDKTSTQPYQPNLLPVDPVDASGKPLSPCPPGTNPVNQSSRGQTENVTCVPQGFSTTALNPSSWSTLFPG